MSAPLRPRRRCTISRRRAASSSSAASRGPTAPGVLAILAKHLGQPEAQLAQGISYDDPEARLDVRDVLHQVAWFKAHGMLPADADGAAMIDKRYALPLDGD